MNFMTIKNRKPAWLLVFLFLLLTQLKMFAQGTTVVTGTVANDKGDMLSGVTVNAANTGTKESYTTVTNEKGIFSYSRMKAGTTYTFTASYIGYETATVKSFTVKEGSNSLLIRLEPSDNSLNQIVVIDYGTQKRETVTGSIATLSAKDFNAGQINDPMTLIAGKVEGLSVSNASRSDPNATAAFSLRGPATVEGNSQPLIVIDGVPGGDLQTIAPGDIASID